MAVIRYPGEEKAPYTGSELTRGVLMYVLLISCLVWDMLSNIFKFDNSIYADRVACNLQFLRWPASFLSPARYSSFIIERCATGELVGVVPVLVLLSKFSLTILVVVAIWVSFWPERHTPRWVISRAERFAFQRQAAKPLTETGFVLRRLLVAVSTPVIIGVSYVSFFGVPPDQTPTDLMLSIIASCGFCFSAMVFVGMPVWLALLVKR